MSSIGTGCVTPRCGRGAAQACDAARPRATQLRPVVHHLQPGRQGVSDRVRDKGSRQQRVRARRRQRRAGAQGVRPTQPRVTANPTDLHCGSWRAAPTYQCSTAVGIKCKDGVVLVRAVAFCCTCARCAQVWQALALTLHAVTRAFWTRPSGRGEAGCEQDDGGGHQPPHPHSRSSRRHCACAASCVAPPGALP